MNHELLTRMLFVDAIVGVGFPHPQVAVYAERDGLASQTWDSTEDDSYFVWNRTALEELPLPTLQDLYTGLKLHEVTHAS